MRPRTAPPLDDSPEARLSRDGLGEVFRSAETARRDWRIGGEAEKFGVDATTGEPVRYDGERGVRRIFDALIRDHGWAPEREVQGGPVVALERGRASITLEPGAQLELSGAPVETIHEICAELRGHLAELGGISQRMNLAWLGVGFHPLARLVDLPWVPKRRYPVMKAFLPTRGPRGLDMMQRTATVQVNIDYANEADAMKKLIVLLRLSPILHAMTSNSPFIEGRLSRLKSERGDVWTKMDPSRSGHIPVLWNKEEARYEDYIDWALQAPMFLFRRGDEFVENTGQTFASFLAEGYRGYHATLADWKLHINSLFPEARLKNTIEARCFDSLPQRLACSVPALITGIAYDDRALDQAAELAFSYDHATAVSAIPELLEKGLSATFAGRPVQQLAEQVLEIADGGLERRGRLAPSGRDERLHLDRLRGLIARGMTPADALVEGLDQDAPGFRRELIARTSV